MSSTHDTSATRASIFVKINETDPQLRELAWEQFEQRYAPIVAGFARSMGLRRPEIDDVVQEIMLAFFKVAPTFKYDPTKRFRGYLRRATIHMVIRRLNGTNGRGEVELVEDVHEDKKIKQVWDDEWNNYVLQRALAEARAEYSSDVFQAFERYVILGESPADVAGAFGNSANWVHKAKERVSRTLRLKIKTINDEL